MGFRKALAERLFSMSRASPSCRTSSSCTAVRSRASSILSPDPGDLCMCRRYIHRRSVEIPPAQRLFPTGEDLLEKIKGIGILKNRIILDGLRRPTETEESPEKDLTPANVKKVMKLAQLEGVKARLNKLQKDKISRVEFMEICGMDCSSADQAAEFAKMLDESGSVIVLDNDVILGKKAQQVINAVSRCFQKPPKELKEMEIQKAAIDNKAISLAVREMALGLGFFIAHTGVVMRLTFWELTWDVMEPICYFSASFYFAGLLAFFLRTQTNPTFQSVYQRRVSMKQKRLMEAQKFDIKKYNELKDEYSYNGIDNNAQRTLNL